MHKELRNPFNPWSLVEEGIEVRHYTLFLNVIMAFLAVTCKSKNLKSQSATETNSVQGKPDKGSEEPVGLPGYPLQCDWIAAPVPENLRATVECFLADSEGEPARLPAAPVWKATYEGPAVLTSVLTNQGIRITIAGSSISEVNKGLQGMLVTVSYDGVERSVTGRDILKPGPGQWRFAGSCEASFILISIDSAGSFTNNTSPRFNGCDTLASALTNITVPNPGFQSLPDLHKTVGAVCNNGFFVLTIEQTGNTINLGGLSSQACLDLSSFVNTLAI